MTIGRLIRVIGRVLVFVPGYLVDILRANLRVAHDVLTPRHLMRPVLALAPIPRELSDWQILLVANLITMTPGTTCLEHNRAEHALLIHVMYRDEIERTRAEVLRLAALVGGKT